MVLRTFCSYQSIPRTEMTASIKNILQILPSASQVRLQGGCARWGKRFTAFEISDFYRGRTFSTAHEALKKDSVWRKLFAVCKQKTQVHRFCRGCKMPTHQQRVSGHTKDQNSFVNIHLRPMRSRYSCQPLRKLVHALHQFDAALLICTQFLHRSTQGYL